MKTNNIEKLIVSSVLIAATFAAAPGIVHADCEPIYGGGEKCVVNKRFQIQKKVIKLHDDKFDDWKDIAKDSDDWEDKVTDVEEDDFVVFKIKVTNKSDEEADEFDNLKMKDYLPDELERIGGAGLTEYWDDFESGETKTFYIAAEVKDDEYDRDEEFEDCVVNEVKVSYDGKYENSDFAKVCFSEGEKEVKELPRTGSNDIAVAIFGLASLVTGIALKILNRNNA